MAGQPLAQPCYVFRVNHFDPIWRRCWDRDFYEDGQRFVSYRAIEEAWIDDAIATCADGVSCFMVECSWVLRHYLERHPEQVATVRRLAQEGRFELLGSGENIVDTNMIHGETLVRNLVLGTRWGEETLGIRPTTGWHSDGFGSCAQMPQIFRQCGYEWLPAISYNTPDAPYWRGLDGSVILFSVDQGQQTSGRTKRFVQRNATASYVYQKLAPCPVCNGDGCDTCAGKGFAIGKRAEFTAPPKERLPGDVGVLMLWGEEFQPGLHVTEDIARFNTEHSEFSVRQGIYRDLRPYIAEELAQVDDPPASLVSSKVENNPSQSGCYVSRIRCKQRHRTAEHALLAAEYWDTLLNDGQQSALLRDAWRKMTLSAFHDAITSTHIDPAYEELMDLLTEVQGAASQVNTAACMPKLTAAEGAVTLFNHHDTAATTPVTVEVPGRWQGAQVLAAGQQLPVYEVVAGEESTAVTFLAKDVPPFAAATVNITEAPARCEPIVERTLSCGNYTVEVGQQGIEQIAVDGVGTVTDTSSLLVGELILEHDLGDPWATRSLDRTRERLSPYTHLQSITAHNDDIIITYTGKHPSVDDPHRCADPQVTYLTWEQRFHLRKGLPWLEVEMSVDWYTGSRRLRMAFPSATDLNRGVYEVPHGVLERDRYEGTTTYGGSAGGDWPAIHWAGVQASDHTFAVFNQGTPSYRVEDGVVLVSVLRSPEIPYGLLEPGSYVTHNYFGMQDHGRHTFRHALYIGSGDWRDNDTVQQARLFNAGVLALPGALNTDLPAVGLQSAHTQITAVKKAEDGNGVILRLAEMAGRAETVRLRVPAAFRQADKCNLLEDTLAPLERDGAEFLLELTPWEIATVRCY